LNPKPVILQYTIYVKLTGKLKRFWSVTVTGNYRIIFRFENETVYDVDYIDYH